MKRAKDQLHDESSYPNLAAFLRNGGTLEVGEDFSLGAFARLRKGKDNRCRCSISGLLNDPIGDGLKGEKLLGIEIMTSNSEKPQCYSCQPLEIHRYPGWNMSLLHLHEIAKIHSLLAVSGITIARYQ